jgi:alpha 1,2-mannosyltransferase
MQVIFLDSDNVAVGDVEVLFESPEYQQHGALLWPDYWKSSAAPDVREILGIQTMPRGTCESGQMVFDKSRLARGMCFVSLGLRITVGFL